MAIQTVFKRYELKYLLTSAQKQAVLEAMRPYMQLDGYGRTVIRNLYCDTDDYRLIRRSIEKPVYKEKLRIRAYAQADDNGTVFVELKKKYEGVVYKRRMALSQSKALAWIGGEHGAPSNAQIAREIDYFLRFYRTLRPTVFLSYEREAYFCTDGSDFRVTFDEHILCRQNDLSLSSPAYGTPILPEGMTLMELKCSGGIPLWLSRVLTEQRIERCSYSKYGTAYRQIIFPQLRKTDVIKEKLTHGKPIQRAL